MTFRDTLELYLTFDLPIVPVNGKNPGVVQGEDWYDRVWTLADVDEWIKNGWGVGLKLGPATGYVDFDVDHAEGEPLFQSFLPRGLNEATSWKSEPKGLIHRLYRVPDELVDAMNKTVRKVDGPKVKAALEIRWGRMQTVIPPSPNKNLIGDKFDLFNVPFITAAHVAKLPTRKESVERTLPPLDSDRPGDLFNALVARNYDLFTELVMKPIKWKTVGEQPAESSDIPDAICYRRPGTEQPWSAKLGHTVNEHGVPMFHPFTTNCPGLEAKVSVLPFTAYAAIHHDGDQAEAASALRSSGLLDTDGEQDSASEFDVMEYTPPVRVEKPAAPVLPAVSINEIDFFKTDEKRPELSEIGYRSFLGQWVKEYHEKVTTSEADPVAVLFQAYFLLGAVLERDVWIERTDSGNLYPQDYMVLAGAADIGRKGTSWDIAKRLFEPIDGDEFLSEQSIVNMRYTHQIQGSVNSEPGFINELFERKRDGEEHCPILLQVQELDLLASKLRIENSTLAAAFRLAWDGTGLSMSKAKGRVHVKKPVVTIIGHTQPLLIKNVFQQSDSDSGFLSRFLCVFCERTRVSFDLCTGRESKASTDVGTLVTSAAKRVRAIVGHFAESPHQFTVSDEALDRLTELYVERYTGRDNSHLLKLCMLTAVQRGLHESNAWGEITLADVEVAEAMMAYCVESAKFLFKSWGQGGAYRDASEKIIHHLAGCQDKSDGWSNISTKLFGGRIKADELNTVFTALESAGVIVKQVLATGKRGRPPVQFTLVRAEA